MKFLVSVDVWGSRCRGLFTGPILDSHADALNDFNHEVRYVVHTDRPIELNRRVFEATGRDADCRPVKILRNTRETITANHRDAISAAARDEVIVFLNADILLSVECFRAIERQVVSGKKVIMCCATRTLPKELPKRKISSAELLSWSISNQHPITSACFYGTGRTTIPWAIYFSGAGSMVLRGFHLHPLAVVNDRDLTFEKSIDWNIASSFIRDEVHVVTSKNELALAEISPKEYQWKYLTEPFNAGDIIAWARRRATEFHWWLFSSRIVIEGEDRDCGDGVLYEALQRYEDRCLKT